MADTTTGAALGPALASAHGVCVGAGEMSAGQASAEAVRAEEFRRLRTQAFGDMDDSEYVGALSAPWVRCGTPADLLAGHDMDSASDVPDETDPSSSSPMPSSSQPAPPRTTPRTTPPPAPPPPPPPPPPRSRVRRVRPWVPVRGERRRFGGGISGALFFRSHDGRFILKTVKRHEAARLLSILEDYTRYCQAQPDTLLPRFYGLYNLHLGQTGDARCDLLRNQH